MPQHGPKSTIKIPDSQLKLCISYSKSQTVRETVGRRLDRREDDARIVPASLAGVEEARGAALHRFQHEVLSPLHAELP